MKRYLITAILLCASVASAGTYSFTGLTGTTKTLDAIPVASLNNGDMAVGYDTGGAFRAYKYDSTEPGAESVPATIIPNDNGTGTGAWVEQTQGALALSELTDDSTHRFVTDAEKTTWNAKSDFDGAYSSLTGTPTLFDGAYSSLTGTPTTWSWNSLTDIPAGFADGTDDGGGDSLPDQTGNAGKVLQTDGAVASWQPAPSGTITADSTDPTLAAGARESKSVNPDKTSGTAGNILLFEANGTDTNGMGFKGPDNATGNVYLELPSTEPTDGQVLQVSGPAATETVGGASSSVYSLTWGAGGGGAQINDSATTSTTEVWSANQIRTWVAAYVEANGGPPDTTNPVVSLGADTTHDGTGTTFTLTSSMFTEANPNVVEYWLDSDAHTTWAAPYNDVDVTIPADTSNHTVNLSVTDLAGNSGSDSLAVTYVAPPATLVEWNCDSTTLDKFDVDDGSAVVTNGVDFVAGRTGNGVEIHTNDYAYITATNGNNINLSAGQITMSIRTTGTPDTRARLFQLSGEEAEFSLYRYDNDSVLRFCFDGVKNALNVTTNIFDGSWHTVVLDWDTATTTAGVTIDSDARVTTTIPGTVPDFVGASSSGELHIGSYSTYFEIGGIIDDFSIE